MTTTDKTNKLLLIITKPEVRKFVEAQKIKEIETVESFYKKKISKHKKIIYSIEPK